MATIALATTTTAVALIGATNALQQPVAFVTPCIVGLMEVALTTAPIVRIVTMATRLLPPCPIA